jgi:hypothetical protein
MLFMKAVYFRDDVELQSFSDNLSLELFRYNISTNEHDKNLEYLEKVEIALKKLDGGGTSFLPSLGVLKQKRR